MDIKTTLTLGLMLGMTVCAYAEDESTYNDLLNERKEYHQEQKAENKAWHEDFKSRKEEAIKGYREEGLSKKEIKENMQTFRDEWKNHRQEQKAENKEYRQGFRSDKREFRQDRMNTNDDGQVGRRERRDFRKNNNNNGNYRNHQDCGRGKGKGQGRRQNRRRGD